MSDKSEYLITTGKKYVVIIDSFDGFSPKLRTQLERVMGKAQGTRIWMPSFLSVWYDTEEEMKAFEIAANRILNRTSR